MRRVISVAWHRRDGDRIRRKRLHCDDNEEEEEGDVTIMMMMKIMAKGRKGDEDNDSGNDDDNNNEQGGGRGWGCKMVVIMKIIYSHRPKATQGTLRTA